MTYWMCQSCGTCLSVKKLGDVCPNCNQKCSFVDVTCYRPDCGGEDNIDPFLVNAVAANSSHGSKITAVNGGISND